MDPLITSGIITGAAALAGSAGNAYAVGKSNKKTREWSEKMYERQKQDNITHWDRQNAYNNPSMQMQRLKAAGLNPNLIYGSGGGQTQAGPISSASAPAYTDQPEQYFSGLGDAVSGGVNQYYSLKQQQATTDQIETATKLTEEQIVHERAKTLATIIGTDTSKFDLDFKKKMELNSMDALKATLERLQTAAYVEEFDKKFYMPQRKEAELQNLLGRNEILGFQEKLEELNIESKKIDMATAKIQQAMEQMNLDYMPVTMVTKILNSVGINIPFIGGLLKRKPKHQPQKTTREGWNEKSGEYYETIIKH